MTAGRGRSKGATPANAPHIPVLLQKVLAALAPRSTETFIDGTFGAGGYSRALLAVSGTRVLAIDRDPAALARAEALAAEHPGRLIVHEGTFARLEEAADRAAIGSVDGIVLDVGVSSMQLDEAARGFSFMTDGPLDMRMGRDGPTAADLVNGLAERPLADLIYAYGEERRSRALARAIVADRASRPFTRTRELASLAERVLGRPKGDDKHPATRLFQALRIAVNDELAELAGALLAAERRLAPGGRLAVVTFHSLEDRIVKRFLKERTGGAARASRHAPGTGETGPRPSFQFVNPQPLTPDEEEKSANPRARSAKLRSAMRTSEPAWGGSIEDLAPRPPGL